MQSPKFIIKNKYLEKNVERDYEYHLKKLGQIKNKVTVKDALEKDQDQMEQVMRRHQNQMKASKFKDDEVFVVKIQNQMDRERNMESASLFDRVLGVNASGPIGPTKQSSAILLKSQLSQTGLVHTKSLVLVVQKNEESRIMEENYKLAKRMQNLPPVISSLGLQSSYTKHKDDVLLARKFHKLQPLTAIVLPQSRFSVYVDVFNDLTNNQFEECKSHITFPVIEERIHKNTMFCILYIQNMKVFNDYDLNNPKVPPKFCWEVKYKNKSLSMTMPKSFNKICKDLVDFVFRKNSVDKLDLVLWKIKNYDEIYIGQIEIGPDDFDDGEVVQEFNKKMIKQKLIEKEMYKKVNSVKAFLGTVQFMMIQFCSKNIPQNKHSGIPGSPRTAEQRRAAERIEESKDNADRESNKEEEHLILLILEATKEGLLFLIISDDAVYLQVIERFSGLTSEDLLMERKKNFALTRKLNKEKMRASLDMLKGLDDNEALTEIHKKLREFGYKGKVSKKLIDDGLKDSNCTLNQLLLQKRDDMNLTLMGIMLLEDQYSIMLEFFNKMDILKESNAVLEDFANDIFNNIIRHLRKNHNLKQTKAFLEALQNYPGISLIIFVYANQEINREIKLGKSNIFLSNFDLNNYEHIMILGKVLKLCDRCFRKSEKSEIILTSDWYNSMQVAYDNEKRNIYFKIPILPKKGKLFEKSELLQLKDMQSNIFHEVVRRKKWNLFTRAYPIACTQGGGLDWYFQKDSTSHSPFMNFIQGACFEDIRSFMQFVDVEQANGAKLITSQMIQESVTSCGKNIFHLLLMNKDPSQEGLLVTIQSFIERLGTDASVNLFNQAWGSGYIAHKLYAKVPNNAKLRAAINGENDKFSPDFTPLVLYLERLACRGKRNKKQLKGIHHINTIIKLLSEHLVKKDNSILRSIYNLNLSLGIEFQPNRCQDFFQEHQQVVKCLINLDDQIFEQTFENFSWIHWIGPSQDINSPILLLSLIKAFRFTRASQIIDLMMDTNLHLQSKLDPTIQLDEEQKRLYDDFYQVQKSRILVACLVALKEVVDPDKQIQEDKLTLYNSISQRIRSIVLQSPNILFKRFGEHTILLNQIYLTKQEAVISKQLIMFSGNRLPLPNFSQITKEVILETLQFAHSKQLQSLLESDIIKAMIATVEDKISVVKYFAIAPDTLLKIFPMDCLHSEIDFDMKVFINQPTLIQTITENINRLKLESKDRSQPNKSIVDASITEESLEVEKPETSEYYNCELVHPYAWFFEQKFPIKLLKEKVLSQKSDHFIQFLVYLYKLMEACRYTDCERWNGVFREFIYECLQQPASSKQLYAGQTVSVYFSLIRAHPIIIKESWMKRLFVLLLRQENYCGLHHHLHLLTTQDVSLFDASSTQYHYLYKRDLKNYFEAATRGGSKNWALSLNNKQFAAMMTDVREFLTDADITGLCNILAVNGLYEKLKMVADKVRNEVELLRILERTSYLAYHQVQDMYAYVHVTKKVEQSCEDHEKSVWNRVETFYPADIHQAIRMNKVVDKQPVSPSVVIDKHVKASFISKWSNLHTGQLQSLLNGIYKQAWPLSNRLKTYAFLAGTVEKVLYKQEYQASLKKSFLHSNPSTLFVQKRDPINRDYSQVVSVLVDQVLSKKIMRRNMSPEVGELTIKIISYCWLALGNFEKITELLSQTEDPYSKKAIVMLVKNATQMFSDKPKQKMRERGIKPELIIDINTYSSQRHKKNPFKTRTMTNILPQLAAFIKKHFNSSVLPVMPANQNYFYSNIKSVFTERHQELTLYQRFVIEFVLTIESNFTPIEITQIPIDYAIQEEQQALSFERLPIMLLNLKTNDKKVVSFLQKHLSKKSAEHNPILRDPVSLYPGNQEFIISMAKQGVNCFMEPPNIARMIKGQTVTFKHLALFAVPSSNIQTPEDSLIVANDGQEASNDQVSNPKLNLLEYLLFKGADYLLNGYFLPHLKPKGGLSEPERKRLIMCALQSGNAVCLQIVYDEILNLKNAELKSTLLKYNLVQATAMSENPAALLYLIRKRLRLVESFTKEEIYQMVGLQAGQTPLLATLAHKHQSASYKEFFYDFVYKHLLKSNDADFREVMETIFFYKFEGMNLLEYCLSYQFYDVVQTFCGCGMVYPEEELEQHKQLLESIPQSRSFFAFQSGQSIDNQLRQDYYQQMNLLQTALKLYKLCKTQTNLNQSLTALNRLETGMFLLPYYKSLKLTFTPMSEQYLVARIIQLLALGELQFSSLGELSESDATKDITGKLFLLHMNGVDKQLQYTLSLDKFVEKNLMIKQSKLYTQVWKNKELLELVSIILNDNITEGFRHKFAQKPTRQEILQFCYTSLPLSGGTNLLFEYFAANEPSLFTKPLTYAENKLPQSIYNDLMCEDQRFMMIVVRGVADKSSSELLEELMSYLVERANEIHVPDVELASDKEITTLTYIALQEKVSKNSNQYSKLVDFVGFKRNILTAFMALLMVNPQKYSKTILQHLKQINWLSRLRDDHPHAAQILSALYNFEGSFQSLSNGLKILMDGLNKNTTYSLMSEVKPLGDLGVNINDEKIYLEGIKLMVEEALKQTQQKVFFPSDTFSRIISSSVKQSLPVHVDKIFKGFAIMKVFVDVAREIENLSNQLKRDPNQRIGDLEYRIEVLQADSANKQPVVLLQQGLNHDEKYKFLFKLPIGLLKNDPSQQLSIYPQPQLNQSQVEQAKQILSQVYLDKFIKIKWSEDVWQLEKHDVFVKIAWDALNTENMSHFHGAIYNLFGLLSFDTLIQTQLSGLKDSKFINPHPTQISTQSHLLEEKVTSKPTDEKGGTKSNDEKVSSKPTDEKGSSKPASLKRASLKSKTDVLMTSPSKHRVSEMSESKQVTQVDQDKYKLRTEDNKLIINDKEQDIPKSNYIQRQRKTNLKLKLENEVAFIELYGQFSYYMKPSYNIQIVSQQEFLKKLKPTAMVHQAIGDLYAYCAMTAECIRVANVPEAKRADVYRVAVQWPVYFNSLDELVHHRDLHPYTMITSLQSRFNDYLLGFIPRTYARPLQISILSVMETTVLRLAQMLEKNLKQFKSIDFNAVVDLALQWQLPKLIIMTILEMVDQIEAKGQVFKSIYVEMSEVEPKKSYDSKVLTNQLEGLDQIFRLAPCCFYVHNRTLVVRLNLCLIKNDPTPLENMLNRSFKMKHFTGSHLILQENTEYKNYMNSIVNKESMLAQILTQKRQ